MSDFIDLLQRYERQSDLPDHVRATMRTAWREIEAERALTDDLYTALDGFWGVGFQLNNDDHPDVVRALARYQKARQR